VPYREFDSQAQQRWWRIHSFIDSLDRRYRANRRVGWVYVMRNSAFRDNLLKIGRSTRAPLERATELGASTSVPTDFELIYFVHASDCHEAERAVHRQLAEFRKTPDKEFFCVPLARAIEALDQAADQYPIPYRSRGQWYHLPQFFEPLVLKCLDCGTQNRVKPLLVETKAKCRSCGGGLRF